MAVIPFPERPADHGFNIIIEVDEGNAQQPYLIANENGAWSARFTSYVELRSFVQRLWDDEAARVVDNAITVGKPVRLRMNLLTAKLLGAYEREPR